MCDMYIRRLCEGVMVCDMYIRRLCEGVMVCDTFISEDYTRVLWCVTHLFQKVLQGGYGTKTHAVGLDIQLSEFCYI